MKYYLLILTTIGLLARFSPAVAISGFEVKVTPNSPLPRLEVYSDDPYKIKYTRSRPKNDAYYKVQVRGRCPTPGAKLIDFTLNVDDEMVLNVDVSGDQRALTGNNGNKWKEHLINVKYPADVDPVINLCNSDVHKKLKHLSHDEVLNSNFTTTGWVNSGKRVEVHYECFGGLGFADIYYDVADLPVTALCGATGYESRLWVTDSTLSLQPSSNHAGSCKLNISGEFRTSYELYALRSKQSTAELHYRFKYQSEDANPPIQYTQWWKKTANPNNAGIFHFDYTDNLPSSIHGGKITLQVLVDDEIQSAASKNFSIDCSEALPLQNIGNLQLNLSLVADPSETIAIGNQLCPTHAYVAGQLKAGYPIHGNMIFLGSSLADLYVTPVDLDAGQSTAKRRRIKLNWASAPGTLTMNAGNSVQTLRKQTLSYGLRVTNSDNELVKSLDKKPFEIHCEYPQVTPGLSTNSTFGMSPHHTGGGGAPTTLKGTSLFNRSGDDNKPVTTGGLRSDGELVQGNGKPLNLITHKFTHTIQKPIQNKVDKDTHDKYANMEISHDSKRAVPSNNDSFNSKNVMLNYATAAPTLYQGKQGDFCNKNNFPKPAVIKHLAKQRYVECINNKVTIDKKSTVKKSWRKGNPILKPGAKK